MNKEILITAVQAAVAGNWHKSHNIAQEFSEDMTQANLANWLHAVMHKMESDEFNSQYW